MDVYDEVDRRENDAGENHLLPPYFPSFKICNVGISADVLTFSI